MTAYFTFDGDRYHPSELTRGPWSPDLQHGGPPTALLARACAAAAPELAVVRVTLELLRPVPLRPLTVRSEVVQAGRTTQRVAATLLDGDVVLARALALAQRPQPAALAEGQGAADLARPPAPEACAPFVFDFFPAAVGYQTSVEMRLASGHFGLGPVCMWMRPRVPLVAGEPLAPLERVLVCADSASGVSQILPISTWSFVNADLDVRLHRAPRGEWIGVDARTVVEPTGLGLCESRLWDADGPVGRGSQALVVRALAAPGARP